MELEILYETLLTYYGPQNWWPGEGFEIAIGTILTQNTAWNNVEKALTNLKQHNLLSPKAILQTDESVLKKLITPAGFFNQKTNYLRNLCSLWLHNPNPTREELLAVKGIGDETADSILLYLLEQPEFVIDAYTIRICNRLGLGTSSSKKYWKNYFQQNLPVSVKLYNEFHALLVKHAKEFCTKTHPRCTECFLNKYCQKAPLRGK
jgi:endonuclease-3 related protein